jgi:hypothetical protein
LLPLDNSSIKRGCNYTEPLNFACVPGPAPVPDFCAGLESHRDAWNPLPLDTEDQQEAQLRKKALEGCHPESVLWMVQIMEAWFLTGVNALKVLFKVVLEANPNAEEIPKADVLPVEECDLRRVSQGQTRDQAA